MSTGLTAGVNVEGGGITNVNVAVGISHWVAIGIAFAGTGSNADTTTCRRITANRHTWAWVSATSITVLCHATDIEVIVRLEQTGRYWWRLGYCRWRRCYCLFQRQWRSVLGCWLWWLSLGFAHCSYYYSIDSFDYRLCLVCRCCQSLMHLVGRHSLA